MITGYENPCVIQPCSNEAIVTCDCCRKGVCGYHASFIALVIHCSACAEEIERKCSVTQSLARMAA